MKFGILTVLNRYMADRRRTLLLHRLNEIKPSIDLICDEFFDTDTFNYDIIKYGREYQLPIYNFNKKPKYCHGNSWNIAKLNYRFNIVTGYAISLDVSPNNASNGQAWVRHSWLVDTETGSTYETVPERFILYFGAEVDRNDLERFKKVMGTGDSERVKGYQGLSH